MNVLKSSTLLSVCFALIALGLSAGSSVAAAEPTNSSGKSDQEKLQGHWQVHSVAMLDMVIKRENPGWLGSSEALRAKPPGAAGSSRQNASVHLSFVVF